MGIARGPASRPGGHPELPPKPALFPREPRASGWAGRAPRAGLRLPAHLARPTPVGPRLTFAACGGGGRVWDSASGVEGAGWVSAPARPDPSSPPPGVGRLCRASVSASVTRGPRCSLHGAVVSGRRKHAPLAARPEGGPGEIGVDGAAAHGRDPESGSEAAPEGSGCGGGGMKRRLGTQRRRRGGETLPSPQGEALGRLGLIPSAATSANLL